MYKSLNEVFERLHNRCRKCDANLDAKNPQSFDHTHGLEIEGFNEKQWCYKTCDCGLQTSYRLMKAKIDNKQV